MIQTQDLHPFPVHSPAEAMFVSRGVLLQQGCELKQGQLLQQIHLQHRLAADLELSRGQAGTMGVLEAGPTEFLGPGEQKRRRHERRWKKRINNKKAVSLMNTIIHTHKVICK